MKSRYRGEEPQGAEPLEVPPPEPPSSLSACWLNEECQKSDTPEKKQREEHSIVLRVVVLLPRESADRYSLHQFKYFAGCSEAKSHPRPLARSRSADISKHSGPVQRGFAYPAGPECDKRANGVGMATNAVWDFKKNLFSRTLCPTGTSLSRRHAQCPHIEGARGASCPPTGCRGGAPDAGRRRLPHTLSLLPKLLPPTFPPTRPRRHHAACRLRCL